MDAAKMQYHLEVQRFELEKLMFKARLAGKELIVKPDGGYAMEVIKDENNQPIKPFCNIAGQLAIMQFIEERLTPNIVLSNTPIERVYMCLMDDHKKLALLIYFNAYKWNVDYGQWESLHFTILQAIESAYRRAVDNEERNWVAKLVNIIQNISGNPAQKNQGVLGGLFAKV